jgi:hypothetical protein
LTVLGARPHLGRLPTAEDAVPGTHSGVVISHALWVRRYGADPGLIGREIEVGRDRREVIGVMPPELATVDRGEGIFLQLDEDALTAWERRVKGSALWTAHKEAHRRNFDNRYSDTAERVHADERLRPPRYWLIHTLAHILIRQCALSCGYASASLSERLYAWEATETRPAAAGLVICTTAADSDGTLGGLVQLSEPARLRQLLDDALYRARRCSSDPICATRTPREPEDYLHGAACHCCVMASETSCERANRFLDRRFLIDLPGGERLGFFASS